MYRFVYARQALSRIHVVVEPKAPKDSRAWQGPNRPDVPIPVQRVWHYLNAGRFYPGLPLAVFVTFWIGTASSWLSILCLIIGCVISTSAAALDPGSNQDPLAGRPAPPTEVTNVVRSFAARGIIRELPAEGKSVVVRHEAIPGFMPKMTMEFTVRDPKELRGLKAGDAISFRVKANEGESWIEGIQRTDETASAPLTARSEPTSGSLLHASQLKPGDLLPDVELLAEDGHPIQLSDFRGRALAFTFIFTRCPLPDFCPRMSQRFNGARELLRQRTAGPTNWQFLSISFDPEVDRPEVLARYARRYRGDEPDRWLFASATTNALASLATSIDFRAANENGSFVHNLRTVVLDPQQHIYRQFDGNRWTAEDLAQALLEAARVKP